MSFELIFQQSLIFSVVDIFAVTKLGYIPIISANMEFVTNGKPDAKHLFDGNIWFWCAMFLCLQIAHNRNVFYETVTIIMTSI